MTNWRTSKVVLSARNLARKIGLTRLIASFRGRGDYEDQFANSMKGLVRPGDIIWDVGANHGLYSKKFLDWTSGSGKVYAFEPGSGNQQQFQQELGNVKDIELLKVALSNRIGTAQFLELPNQNTASHLLDADVLSHKAGKNTTVEVTTGDAVVRDGRAEIPHVIKIDTEGHEWEVLDGMPNLLKNTRVECLCVEIHFRILEERGLRRAPADIEQLLKEQQFTIKWCDASHIIAKRGR